MECHASLAGIWKQKIRCKKYHFEDRDVKMKSCSPGASSPFVSESVAAASRGRIIQMSCGEVIIS